MGRDTAGRERDTAVRLAGPVSHAALSHSYLKDTPTLCGRQHGHLTLTEIGTPSPPGEGGPLRA